MNIASAVSSARTIPSCSGQGGIVRFRWLIGAVTLAALCGGMTYRWTLGTTATQSPALLSASALAAKPLAAASGERVAKSQHVNAIQLCQWYMVPDAVEEGPCQQCGAVGGGGACCDGSAGVGGGGGGPMLIPAGPPTQCGTCGVGGFRRRTTCDMIPQVSGPMLVPAGPPTPIGNHPAVRDKTPAPCGEPKLITGVDSKHCRGCGESRWHDRSVIPFETFGQGEYVGPHRPHHVDVYRLRVDDELQLTYRLTRVSSGRPYKLTVGDRVRVESVADEQLDRELAVQPDGTLTMPLMGQVMAAGRTTEQLRKDLEVRFQKYYKVPGMTITPVQVNTRLEDLRDAIAGSLAANGQVRTARVSPDGTIQLPGIGSICTQGLTMCELQREIDARYRDIVDGLEVTPALIQRAPRFIYVLGEVTQPGRFELTGPTTAIQAIALAEGWVNGANLRQVVVLRRADDWRLMATMLDLNGALLGRRPTPSDEIWLRDSDIVIVPKSPIKVVTDAISLVATQGAYAIAPILADGTFFTESSL